MRLGKVPTAGQPHRSTASGMPVPVRHHHGMLIAVLALQGCPRVGAAQGTWSVISLPPKPGEVLSPHAPAVDTAGNLSVAEGGFYSPARIQKRDAQGNWSAIATEGTAAGEVIGASGLAVDTAANLYVADWGNNRVLKYTPRP
jgi:hypothetical protein